MILKQALIEKKFDVRICDKLLADGRISAEEYKEHLDGLADTEEDTDFVISNQAGSTERQIS